MSTAGRANVSLAVAVGAALIVALAFDRQAALRGWLIAFALWSSVPIGALVLILIGTLTGGRWTAALAPVLVPVTAVLPLACLAFLPIATALDAIYPWAASAGAAPPGVARFYLNGPAFLVRAVIALGGWSFLAWAMLPRSARLAAGLGLAFHGLIISFVAVDWILSVEPRYPSSSFAAGIAVQQILAALAFVAIVAPPQPADRARDLAGLLLTALLGVIYLDLMAYIVAWYGNLPEKAAWYVPRSENGWGIVITAAALAGGILPAALLLTDSVRRSASALRIVGALALLGVALHVAWLLAPALGAESLAPTALALVVLIAASLALATLFARSQAEEVAHAD